MGKKIYFLILPVLIISLGIFQLTQADLSDTSVTANNDPPVFTVNTDDSSDATTPTDNGNTVTFTTTATDANSDNYYLIVCADTDTVTANNNSAPSCSSSQICVSGSTASGSQASCTSSAISTSSETVAWESFVCDHNSAGSCSATETTNSPYNVNHPPSLSAIAVTDTLGGSIEPGETLKFTATIADSDVSGGQDTVSMAVCTTDSTFNGSADPCSGGTTVCTVTGQTPGSGINCSGGASLITVPTAHGDYGYASFIYDEHDSDTTVSADAITDGNMEAADTSAWTPSGSGTTSKVADERTGGSGSQSIKVLSSSGDYAATQDVLTTSTTYTVSGWAKSGGSGCAGVSFKASPDVITSGTTWTYFSVTGTANSSTLALLIGCGAGSGDYAQFDDVSVVEEVYTVADVAPVVDSITIYGNNDPFPNSATASETPTGSPSAVLTLSSGSTADIYLSSAVHDDNGDGDILETASVKLFDSAADGGTLTSSCSAATGTNSNAQQECYLVENFLSDGDMEESGTSNWTNFSASSAKETTEVYEGSQSMKITQTTASGDGGIYQNILTSGTTYTISGYYKTDGNATAHISFDGATHQWSGTATTWTAFSQTLTADNVYIVFHAEDTGGSGNSVVYYDDLRVASTAEATGFCELRGLSTGTSAKTGTGSDANAYVYCKNPINFNANASSGWGAYIEIDDETTTNQSGTTSQNNYQVDGLLSIGVKDSTDGSGVSIGFPALAPGTNSNTTNQAVYIANLGNTLFDVQLLGSDMCDNWNTAYTNCSGNSILASYQKFGTGTFDYDLAGTALSNSSQCNNMNVPVRIEVGTYTNDVYNLPIYFGIGLPAGTSSGIYTGQNTFSSISACP